MTGVYIGLIRFQAQFSTNDLSHHLIGHCFLTPLNFVLECVFTALSYPLLCNTRVTEVSLVCLGLMV